MFRFCKLFIPGACNRADLIENVAMRFSAVAEPERILGQFYFHFRTPHSLTGPAVNLKPGISPNVVGELDCVSGTILKGNHAARLS